MKVSYATIFSVDTSTSFTPNRLSNSETQFRNTIYITNKMIEGPVGDMIERNHARQDFKMPPYLADRRPEALATGGTVVALLCSDPRLDPRKILVLDGTPGRYPPKRY